jgi:hypothetical protein
MHYETRPVRLKERKITRRAIATRIPCNVGMDSNKSLERSLSGQVSADFAAFVRSQSMKLVKPIIKLALPRHDGI